VSIRFYLPVTRTMLLSAAASLLLLGFPAKQQGDTQQRELNAQVTPASRIQISAIVTRDGGNFVSGLGQGNFSVEEDGAPRKVLTVDHYDASDIKAVNRSDEVLRLFDSNALTDRKNLGPLLLHHRLIVLYFDMASLSPAELERSVKASQEFVSEQTTSSDLVAVVSFGASFVINVNFTGKKGFLESGLDSLLRGRDSESGENSASPCPQNAPYCEDFTESASGYNIHNLNDRSTALTLLTAALMTIPGRKSIIHFTGSAPHAKPLDPGWAVETANLGMVSLYEVAVREVGRVNSGPGSTITSADSTKTAAPMDSLNTLGTLAKQTGGSLYTTTKDFRPIFEKVKEDSKQYYLLIYKNSISKNDGTVRHISVTLLNVPGAKLTFRPTNFRIPGVEF
jgi:VWFA-related protein